MYLKNDIFEPVNFHKRIFNIQSLDYPISNIRATLFQHSTNYPFH